MIYLGYRAILFLNFPFGAVFLDVFMLCVLWVVILARARLWHRPMPQPGVCSGLGFRSALVSVNKTVLRQPICTSASDHASGAQQRSVRL